ncbi:P-loop containing nucleoside triphosphate hydrolase protein [Hysterangium stoloniferum]|nr:P-loop containing nucleoside triphosphate hydrolase protein [Hysterangium stoloniferum]
MVEDLPSPPPDTPPLQTANTTYKKRVKEFWVSPPRLDPSEKATYKDISSGMVAVQLDSDEDHMPVEIVGEIRLGTDLYYWVNHENDVVYRVISHEGQSTVLDIQNIEDEKENGFLETLDPNSSRIHPKHRVRLQPPAKVTRSKGTTVSRPKYTRIEDSDEAASDSQSESEDIGDEDDFKASKGKLTRAVGPPSRRSRRAAGKQTNYRDMSASPPARPVSTRRAAARHGNNQSAYVDHDEEEYEDDSDEVRPKNKTLPKKKPIRGRLSRAAYGNIRPVADLSDDESDDESALHAHRETCDKCRKKAAHVLLAQFYKKPKAKPGRKKATDEFEESDDEEQRLTGLGGWVRCMKCCVTSHWKCLTRAQRDEILKAARAKAKESEAAGLKPQKRDTLEAYDTTEFFCSACIQGGICMYCRETAVAPESLPGLKADVDLENKENTDKIKGSSCLLFRCATCKRLAHYEHLPQPDSNEVWTPAELAQHYQQNNEWKCTDCISFVYPLDRILAWRPYPANAVESSRRAGEVPDHRALLPREYLVKWIDRSYRRLQWVPHMWLLSTAQMKLKNFLASGPKVQLLDTPIDDVITADTGLTADTSLSKEHTPSFLITDEVSRTSSTRPESEQREEPAKPLPDAEARIPLAWRTVDRVLDVRFWVPDGRRQALQHKRSKSRKGKGRDKSVIKQVEAEIEAERIAARMTGEEPSEDLLEIVDEWEERTGYSVSVDQAGDVIWAFVKWNELSYEEATWDSPPAPEDPSYAAFEKAFQRFLDSREVFVVKKDKKAAKEFDLRPKHLFEQRHLALTTDPDSGQEGKLMPFQLIGVNWLYRNWWRHQPSILADDMGLGKTVQITSFLGHLLGSYEASPTLVIVPNSTITNWLREFDKWAPRLRVVPFNGDAKSRDIIRQYELYHDSVTSGCTNLKFNVLVTTYETLIGKDFSTVFKRVPRWELLIVDEGQRLKSDSSLLFKRLNELNALHRILMTGTPLNNNIRELFNLMNFLDADEWSDLEALEKEHEVLTEDLILKLHERLKPYFLRRTKADVLKLPPKNEVIVPVSMTAIQKEVYKSLLSQNVEILGSLTQSTSRVNNAIKKSNLNNLLMQLRKCLQHPYLVSPELEPSGPHLTKQAAHVNLRDASAKLRLLHMMLPKLKAKGHRVLLFSQFVIALDIIEDFITGENYNFLRLDGNTKQSQRQKDMDLFNKPDSDVFIYLLSTRAGGVGINLWSADTVIIFDPDFNPHQDLQAISRAHRYGQTKSVLVFKFMVKGAAEERIVQTGKKKLALDHLIVQKMDEDGVSDDVQSILTFGAKAIFENSEVNDIHYSEADIDKLIERTELEGDKVAESAESGFGFAKLWVVEKDSMEEIIEDTPPDTEENGFWEDVLARATNEKAKAKAAEVTGRGAKRKAAAIQFNCLQKYTYDDESPEKLLPKKRRKSTDDDVPYNVSEHDSDNDRSGPSSPHTPTELSTDDELLPRPQPQRADPFLSINQPPAPVEEKQLRSYKPAVTTIQNHKRVDPDDSDDERPCGLCHGLHGPGECFMTQNPENLVDYRRMLLTESRETMKLRRAAVQAIDSYLASRGLTHLVKSQGLLFTENSAPLRKKHKSRSNNKVRQTASASTTRPLTPEKVNQRQQEGICVICGGGIHLVKVCPVVKAGPARFVAFILRRFMLTCLIIV